MDLLMHDMHSLRRLFEDAPPVGERSYFHGTNTLAKAKTVMREGLHPDKPSQYVRGYAPLDGHVYLAPTLREALQYAIKPTRRDEKADLIENPDGFVFIITPSALTGVLQPDEDDVGAFMSSHSQGRRSDRHEGYIEIDGETVSISNFDYKACPSDRDPAKSKRIWSFIMHQIDNRLLTRIDYDDDDAVATCGKIALASMPVWMKQELIGNGANVAHAGVVMPDECWRIAKTDGRKLLLGRDDDFFRVAEKIWSRKTHA